MTRELMITLLMDEWGVSYAAWVKLMDICVDNGWRDILLSVRATENRFYLPEDWNE